MLYVDGTPLATPPTDRKREDYNRLLLKDYGPIRVLGITEHTLRFKASKTSLKIKSTLYETGTYTEKGVGSLLLTDSYTETEAAFPRHEKFYTETRLPFTTYTDTGFLTSPSLIQKSCTATKRLQ